MEPPDSERALEASEMDAFAGKIVGWRRADMSRTGSIRPSSLAIPRRRQAVFELLLDPLIVRLGFKWSRRPRRDLEEQAIDSILSYLERPERYEPVRASLLTYLTMDAHGDLLNAYERETSAREKLTADVEDPGSYRNSVSDGEGSSTDDRRLLARLREAFPDEHDRRGVYLLLEGERATPAYAEAPCGWAIRDRALGGSVFKVRRL